MGSTQCCKSCNTSTAQLDISDEKPEKPCAAPSALAPEQLPTQPEYEARQPQGSVPSSGALPVQAAVEAPRRVSEDVTPPTTTVADVSRRTSAEAVALLPEKPCLVTSSEAKITSWVKGHPNVSRAPGGAYFLDQTFAIVRHGDRLDHTPEWESFKDRRRWPNDTPLTGEGHKHATEVGQILAATGKPFELIISSPYFRCAQTASRIAQSLHIPVHLDLDLGEVFDQESMVGDIGGKPQHREPKELKQQLLPDFPNVEYVADESSNILIEGKLQPFPEPFAGARMRFCYKVKKLLQRAASELMSIVIVTHGDGVAAVVGLLREAWSIRSVPYTAYALATRRVKVMEKDDGKVIKEEPVYVHPEEWKITLSKGFLYNEVKSLRKKQQMHKEHDQEMQQMNAKAAEIKTDYTLEYDHHEHFMAALERLGSSKQDMDHMMGKAASSHHIATENAHRIQCSPKNSLVGGLAASLEKY